MSTKVEQWKAKQKVKVTLPSGTEVNIRIPNLLELIREGQVPNQLVKFAQEVEQQQLQGEMLEVDKLKEATDFIRFLVSTTVVEPKIEPDDVPGLPTLDADMLMEFGLRQRQVDALGNQVGGLDKVAAWRKFHLGSAG